MLSARRISRLISAIFSVCLVVRSFIPGIIYADEATPSASVTVEVTPTPSPTPVVTPTPEPVPTEVITPTPSPSPTVAITPEASPSAEPTPVVTIPQPEADPPVVETLTTEVATPAAEPTLIPTPSIPVDLWVKVNETTDETTENVGEGVDYHFRDTNFSIRFTKVTKPGKLKIEQIKLSSTQIAATGSISDTVYNITSGMESGSFVYDLTIPVAVNDITAEVKYAEGLGGLANAKTVSQNKEMTSNVVVIRSLDHFTIFYVTNGEDRSEDGGFCDFLPCLIKAEDIENLKENDGNFFELGNSIGWDSKAILDDHYVEFVFDPQLTAGTTVTSAKVKLVYKNQYIDSGKASGGQVKTVSDGETWIILADSDEHEYDLNLSDLSIDKLNSLRIRFFQYGTPIDGQPAIKTFFDQVTLDIDEVVPDQTAPSGSITIPADGAYKNTKPTFRASASDESGIAFVKFQYKVSGTNDFIDLNTDASPSASLLYQASLSGVTLVNGTSYDLQIVIADNAGNQATVGGVSFTYDNQDPGIIYNSPLSGETVWNNTEPTLDIDFMVDGGAPLNFARYRLNDGAYKNIFVTDRVTDFVSNWKIASWADLLDGYYEVDLRVADIAGNGRDDGYVSGLSGFRLGKDVTKPESVITSPSNNGSNSVVYYSSWNGSITGTASDNLSGISRVELTIQKDDGEEIRVTADGTTNWTYLLENPTEGSYKIVSHAIDNAGNVENSYHLTVVYDKTIPEVEIELNPTVPDGGNQWYKTNPTITLEAVDENIDYIEYQWNSTTGLWTAYGSAFTTPNEGGHVLYYRALDMAGNISQTGIKYIRYDKTELEKGPQNITANPDRTTGNTTKIKWESASDNVGIEKYEVNWSLDGTGIAYSSTVGNEIRELEINRLDHVGKWNITVTAFDYAGNKKSGSVEVFVNRQEEIQIIISPPAVSLTPTIELTPMPEPEADLPITEAPIPPAVLGESSSVWSRRRLAFFLTGLGGLFGLILFSRKSK